MSILITPHPTNPAWQTRDADMAKDGQTAAAWPRPPRRKLTPTPVQEPDQPPADRLDVDEHTHQQAMSDALEQASQIEANALSQAARELTDPRRRFRPPDGQDKWTKQALMQHIKQQAAARWCKQQEDHTQPSPTWVDRPLWEQEDDTQGEDQ